MTALDEAVLVATAFVTAILSGTLGMGGGVVLIAVMANYLPPVLVIPLHGIIQWISNLARIAFHLRQIDWRVALTFASGAAVGAIIGAPLVIAIPQSIFLTFLAVSILMMTWWRRAFSWEARIPHKFAWVGGVSTFLSLFLGSVGPLIAPFFLREGFPQRHLVATKAACQIFTHTFKIAVYLIAGFSLGAYAKLVGLMVAAVILGNWFGKIFLLRLPAPIFDLLFRVVVTLLSLRMLYQAWWPAAI